jgi:phage-related protein
LTECTINNTVRIGPIMTDERRPETPVVFYRTSSGDEPVRAWLRTLSVEDRRQIGADLAVVQFGWPVGMPLCRALGGGLWEVRSNLPGRWIVRLLFCFHDGRIGVVHGFIKKTRRTPIHDIELARRRMREMVR